jgi:hypothetical protein
MVTLSLQWANSLLWLLFAGVALAVSRRASAAPALHRTCWLWVGLAFLLSGVVATMQDVLGTWAFLAGPESAAWVIYLRVAPSMNHSRIGLELALWCVLGILTFRAPRDAGTGRLGSVLLLGVLVGIWLGAAEGVLREEIHYPLVALFTFANFMLLLGLLYATLVRDVMDWVLWMILLLHALMHGFHVTWFTVLFGINQPEVWSPPIWASQLSILGVAVAWLTLAWVRLIRARRDAEVPTLMELVAPAARFNSLG